MKFVLFFLFLLSCESETQAPKFLPDNLPSEEVIKQVLSSDKNMTKLRNRAMEKQVTLEEWKKLVRQEVTDPEISRYSALERKSASIGEFDTDAIDKKRESIRIRLAWSRMLSEANISWKEHSASPEQNILAKIKLNLTPTVGKSPAKWTIVEWSDYHCTFCKQTHPHTRKILENYKGQVLYYHKDFPLDSESDEGLLPLAFARCFWEKDSSHYVRHTIDIYENINHLENLKTEAGLDCDPKKLDRKYFKIVLDDFEEASRLGVGSIPTFWVNGRWIVGSLDEKTWARILRETSRK